MISLTNLFGTQQPTAAPLEEVVKETELPQGVQEIVEEFRARYNSAVGTGLWRPTAITKKSDARATEYSIDGSVSSHVDGRYVGDESLRLTVKLVGSEVAELQIQEKHSTRTREYQPLDPQSLPLSSVIKMDNGEKMVRCRRVQEGQSPAYLEVDVEYAAPQTAMRQSTGAKRGEFLIQYDTARFRVEIDGQELKSATITKYLKRK